MAALADASIEELEGHLVRLCNAVGGFETKLNDEYEDSNSENSLEKCEQAYVLGDEGIECLKDLKRLLREDDRTDEKILLRKLGTINFLKSDLIPILSNIYEQSINESDDGGSSKNKSLYMAALELLVPLTWPVDPTKSFAFEQQKLLVSYKESLADVKILKVIMDKMIEALSIDYPERTIQDFDIVRMSLIFIRNVLQIEDITDPVASEKLHLKLMRAMEHAKFDIFFETLSLSIDETGHREWNRLLLDIFCKMLLPYSVEDLNCADLDKFLPSRTDNVFNRPGTKALLSRAAKNRGRHPGFKGVFSVTIENQPYVVSSINNPEKEVLDNQDKGKKAKRNFKSKKFVSEEIIQRQTRSMSKTTQSFLIKVMSSLLLGGFNVLIKSVKRDLEMERDFVVDDDFENFYFISAFTLNYINLVLQKPHDPNIKFSSIGVLLNNSSVMLILRKITNYQVEKKEILLKRTLNLFSSLLNTLELMKNSSSEIDKDAANTLLSNIFYQVDYLRSVVSTVSRPFVYTRQLLEAAVEANHFMMKALERYSKERTVIVQRARKKKAHPKNDGHESDEDYESEDELQNTYKELIFEFESFQMEYAFESVVNSYITLLEHYRQLPSRQLHYISHMLHRIFVKCKMPSLFFKLDTLYLFDKILNREPFDTLSMSPESKKYVDELKHLLRKLVSSLIAKLNSYPVLFAEILFPKSRADCKRISNDGKTEISKEKKEKKKEQERQNAEPDLLADDSNENPETSHQVNPSDTSKEVTDKQISSSTIDEVDSNDMLADTETRLDGEIVSGTENIAIPDDKPEDVLDYEI